MWPDNTKFRKKKKTFVIVQCNKTPRPEVSLLYEERTQYEESRGSGEPHRTKRMGQWWERSPSPFLL